jgi:hypothetical protein
MSQSETPQVREEALYIREDMINRAKKEGSLGFLDNFGISGYWLNAQGYISQLNDQFKKYYRTDAACLHQHIETLTSKTYWQECQKAMLADKETTYEETWQQDGEQPMHVICVRAPLFADSGQVLGLIGLDIDITAYKLQQQSEEQEQTVQNHRIAAQRAGSGMHNYIKKPLDALSNQVDWIQNNLPEVLEHYKKMEEEGKVKPLGEEAWGKLNKIRSNLETAGNQMKFTKSYMRVLAGEIKEPHLQPELYEKIAIHTAITNAITSERYSAEVQEKFIFPAQQSANFHFWGNAHYLQTLIHHLLLNTFLCLHQQKRQPIVLRTHIDENTNYLIVEDNGKDTPNELAIRLQRGYQKGDDAGLNFCHKVMASFNGGFDIQLSNAGVFHCIFSFPKLAT